MKQVLVTPNPRGDRAFQLPPGDGAFQLRQCRSSFHCCGHLEEPCWESPGLPLETQRWRSFELERNYEQVSVTCPWKEMKQTGDYDPGQVGSMSAVYVARNDLRLLCTAVSDPPRSYPGQQDKSAFAALGRTSN